MNLVFDDIYGYSHMRSVKSRFSSFDDEDLRRFMNHFVADRYAGGMDRLAAPRNQGVPPAQLLTLGEQTIRAGRWQPVGGPRELRGYLQAVGYADTPVRIVRACAGAEFEQPTDDFGKRDLSGVDIFKLDQAALGAAVAKRFPLVGVHLVDRLRFPERCSICHGVKNPLP